MLMKYRQNQARSGSCFLTSIFILLLPTLVPGQGAPDIVWSRSDHTNAVNSVAFAQDGTLVASASSDATIRIWQSSNGNPVITLANQETGVLQVAFESNGTLASWDVTNALKVWQVSNGAVVRVQQIPGLGWRTAFAPSGDLFAAAGSTTLYVWRVLEGALVRTLLPDQDASPSFSPNGRMVAAGLHLAEEYRMNVWLLADGAVLKTFTNYKSGISIVSSPVFSPDSTRIAALTGPYGGTEIWNLQSGNLWGLIPEETSAPGLSVNVKLLVFTPDGKIAIMSDRDDKIRIWRLSEGQEIVRLALYDLETAGINELAMSPKGGLFAFGRLDGKVIVARVPVFITEARLSASNFILQWSGGSGSYQLQQRTNLATGTWENVGASTTATGVTNNVSGASLFYRVQSLPN